MEYWYSDCKLGLCNKMKPEAQQIAIAEACDWTEIREQDYTPFATDPYIHGPEQIWIGKNPETGEVEPLADYLNDLNAMHEAEKTLTYAQGGEMSLWITRINGDGYGPQLFATAAQRAEAFLRTIGKWEE